MAQDVAVIVFAPLAITQVVAAVGIGPLVDRFVPHRLLVLPMTIPLPNLLHVTVKLAE